MKLLHLMNMIFFPAKKMRIGG